MAAPKRPCHTPAMQRQPEQRAAPPDDKPHYLGHRDRLRRRLIEKGAGSLSDYEVVEVLLFGAKRQGDTKPLAKDLLKRFGGLAGLLSAEPAELEAVKGLQLRRYGDLGRSRQGLGRARREVPRNPGLPGGDLIAELLDGRLPRAQRHSPAWKLRHIFVHPVAIRLFDRLLQTPRTVR